MKALKKVPPGAKGLSKLPTSVRNKMGYMQKGGKITKKMVDDQFNRNLDSHANTTNRLAKQAATGLKPNGFPMKPKNRKALQKDVDQRKAYEQKAKPNYRYVGTSLPGGPAPFEDDAMPKAKKGMKAVKKYQKGGKVKKSYKKTSLSTKDQEGSFSARTKRTKSANSPFASIDSEYTQKYQNKIVGKGGTAKRIGYQEERMRSRDKFDKVMGLRAEAYQARENKFGTKKPKAKVMKSGGKVVKYQKGGANPTPTERTMTGEERRQTRATGNQPSASYKGYGKTKTPKEILESTEMARLKAALQQKKYPVNGMDLAEMRKVAKKEGMYDKARGLAREDYQKAMAKRR